MAATWLYRVASILFVLFALGHTYGFLSFCPSSAEGRAVYESMNSVHLVERGRSYTYGGFYRGFGLSATISMLFWAFLCWYLGELTRTNPADIGALVGPPSQCRLEARCSASSILVCQPWCYLCWSRYSWAWQPGWRAARIKPAETSARER
jgi:hypothetical protein